MAHLDDQSCRARGTPMHRHLHPPLKRWAILFRPAWRDCRVCRSAIFAEFPTTEDYSVSKPAVDCPENHFGNRAFHCVNPAMAIDLQLNEHSFGEVAASLPADGFLDCECGRPGTPASVHGPPMKRDSQAPLAATGNAGGGTNRNAEKYQRILDAAVAVFADKGFPCSRERRWRHKPQRRKIPAHPRCCGCCIRRQGLF